MFRLPLTSLLAAILSSACGPAMEITSPSNNAVVVPNTDGTIEVSVQMHGFTIRPAGECAGEANCGHFAATLSADDRTGDDQWLGFHCSDQPDTHEPTFTIDLASCHRQVGNFGLLVALHTDDHAFVEGSGVGDFLRFVVEESMPRISPPSSDHPAAAEQPTRGS